MNTAIKIITCIIALLWCSGNELHAQRRMKVLGQRFDSLGANAPIMPTIGPFRTDIRTTATIIVAVVNDKNEIDTNANSIAAQLLKVVDAQEIVLSNRNSVKGVWNFEKLEISSPYSSVEIIVTSSTLQLSTTITVSTLGGLPYYVTVATLSNGKPAAPGLIKYNSQSPIKTEPQMGSSDILQLGKHIHLYGSSNTITLIARDREGKVPMPTMIEIYPSFYPNNGTGEIDLENYQKMTDSETGIVQFDKLLVIGSRFNEPKQENKLYNLGVWFTGAYEAMPNAINARDYGYISFSNISIIPGEPSKFVPVLRDDIFTNNQRLLRSKIGLGATLYDTISVQLVDKWNNPVTWYQGTRATLSLNEPFKLSDNSVTSTTAVRGAYHFLHFTPLGPKSTERGDVKLTIKNHELGISYLDSTTFSVFSGIKPYNIKQMTLNKPVWLPITANDQFEDFFYYPLKTSLTVTVLAPYTSATQSVNRADSVAENGLFGFHNFVPGAPASMKEGDVTLRFTALPSGFTTTATTTFVPATGIRENFSVGGFTLAPNPCSEFVIISSAQHNIRQTTLVIYDLLGNLVLRKEVDFGIKAVHTIQLGNLAAGAYSLSLMTAQGVYSTSLMVVR